MSSMNEFSPREIVSELDRYIIGQNDAKRAVAIALRNRWRRLQLSEDLREEVLPKNILMIGPTDVDQIVRDLLEIGITMTRERLRLSVKAKAELRAEERVLDALVGGSASPET